jgi:hypothetical protein
MAQLAPLAAASAVPATAGAAALAKGATMAAGSGLASGLAAGTALGSGASMLSMPALSYAGSNLALPALASKGLAATAPAAGIFSKAMPALAGLPSAAPTAGIFAKASPALGGLKSFAPLASQTAPSSFGAINQAMGLGTPSLTSNVPTLTKTAGTVTEKLAATTPQVAETPGLVEKIRNLNTAVRGPVDMSYAPNAQGLAANAAPLPPSSSIIKGENFFSNLGNLAKNPSVQGVKDYAEEHPYATSAAVGLGVNALMGGKPKTPPEQDKGMIRPYQYTRTQRPEAYAVSPLEDTSEQLYFDTAMRPLEPYSATSEKAKEIRKIAEGGIAKAYAVGGPIETMAAMNAVGANTGYPMAGINTPMYSNPMMQRPEAVNVLSPTGDAGVGAYSGEPKFARGGLSDLGDYSDGGRLLKGPGDGVSDSIPAVIGKRQPARLADGEFVIPARIVSELGNGSTEAGARKLYAMMDRIQKGRRKSVGKGKVAVDSKSDKHLPA